MLIKLFYYQVNFYKWKENILLYLKLENLQQLPQPRSNMSELQIKSLKQFMLDDSISKTLGLTRKEVVLHMAVKDNNFKAVKILLDLDIYKDEYFTEKSEFFIKDIGYKTFFRHITNCDNIDIIKLFINVYADLSVRDINGGTALHVAAKDNKPGLTKLFLDSGVDHSLLDNDGKTALHIACGDNDLGDINPQIYDDDDDYYYKEDLYTKSLIRHPGTVKILLNFGADHSITDRDGVSPLHHASSWGHSEIVKILLDAGADYLLVDNRGMTALKYASKYEHLDVIKIFLDTGLNKISNKTEITKILLDMGLDYSTRNYRKDT